MAAEVVPAAADEAADVGDLLPRADISPLLTDAILSDLSSSAWLTRKAAADAIDQILTDSGMPATPLLTGRVLLAAPCVLPQTLA